MYVPQGKISKTEQVKVVRAYATNNYSKDGWDILVEAMDDQEIITSIGKAKTGWSAIVAVGKVVKALHAHRSEIQATAF